MKTNWHFIDLEGQILGRVATKIALLLMGKQKTDYLPNLDNGDFVVAINAAKIKVTGKKLTDKSYYSHSGYPGGLREITLEQLLKKDPRRVIENAVKNMLPKNKLQDRRMVRLKVFPGTEHKYEVELGLKKNAKS
ncbi:MAG: 50S ribosomal protein L13 [uncultured bacterium]|nr:MAG: 50S ribosomal protein L13 [uncultured bacterium]